MSIRVFLASIFVCSLLILLIWSAPTHAGILCYEEVYAPNLVRAAQMKLAQSGCYNSSVDGKWGPKTRTGVSCFQRQKKLDVTGDLDDQTLKSMFGDDVPAETRVRVTNPHDMPADVFDRYCGHGGMPPE